MMFQSRTPLSRLSPLSRSSSLFRGFGLLAVSAMAATAAFAATPANRLRADARLTERAELPQAVSARLASSQALGAVDANTTLDSMALVLAPTAAQTADLNQLLADQQDSSSPHYRQWLTPAQFGERFGVSDADLQVLKNWLTSQGLQVVDVAASRNMIRFSGTASNVDTAFHAGLQRFQRDGQKFISNTAAPSMPSAFAGVVGGVQGLSTYRLRSHSVTRPISADSLSTRLTPDSTETYTDGTVRHFLVPYDIRQIYGATGLFGSGYTGAGVTIGVIGQTAVNTTQLGYYQTLTGQPVVAPTLTLVPGSGTSTLVAVDEGEAESDLELAGGVAQGATINFIYTGNGNNDGVFTSLQYAITNNIGSILTLSYGGCEVAQGTSLTTMEPFLRQASAQGQTIVNSSGDSSAAGCDDPTLAKSYDGLAVSYPASSPNVTGVGGTMFVEGTGTYWSATNNSQRGSALSYIPEQAWNESAATSTTSASLAGSGGGPSSLFSRPAWQTGTGLPTDAVRHVPDVAFSAATGHDGYIFCSADTSITSTSAGVTTTGACTATTRGGFIVGGTSLSTPSFAGLIAITEQANGGKRLGNLNPKLYALAASNPGVFNDVASGSNQVPCVAGIPGCVNGVLGYAATVGYDQATGLGSVNTGAFSAAITTATTATLRVPTVTILQTSMTATTSVFSIAVSSISGSTIPTGTVSVSLDGGTATTLTLTSGATSTALTTSGLSAGTHTVTAVYSGDTNYATASSTFTVTTGATPTFTLTANPTTLAVATGATGSATLTLTSTGYTGLVLYTVAPASGSATAPGCFTGDSGDATDNNPSNASTSNNYVLDSGITAGSTFSAAIRYHAVTTSCSGLTQLNVPANGMVLASTRSTDRHLPWAAFAFGGFLVGGLTLRRRTAQMRLLSSGLLAVAFTVALFGAAGCGSGSAPLTTTTTTTTTTSAKTYNYVVTATSYPSGLTTASANLTITVQ